MPWRYCHGICAISCYVEIISASVNGYKNHNMEGDRYEIPGNRRGNAEDLMELGQSIYDRFENGEELDEASKGLCEAIASRKESIEEYENKIEGLKGACECTRCGKMVAKDMAFCPYCGSPVTEEEDIFEADDLAQEVREEAEEAEESVTEAAEAAVEAVTEAAEEAVDAVEESVKEETEE
jgi:hypothetical protein